MHLHPVIWIDLGRGALRKSTALNLTAPI